MATQLGPKGDMRSCGVLSVVFKTSKCTSHLGIGLVAVTRGANRSKGAKGPEEWRPPDEDYWCQYATDWTEVKMEWGLTMTQREPEAVIVMLDTCDEPVEFEAERADGTAGADTSGQAASGEAAATPTLVLQRQLV